MNRKILSTPHVFQFITAVLVAMILLFAGTAANASLKQKEFATPEDAVKAVVAAARNDDADALISIFGQSAEDLLFSGDPVDDKQRREKFLERFDEKNSLVSENGDMVIVIGKDGWPFPIPIVQKDGAWFFNSEKGREEILNRRIGENELSTIQTMLAIVDAQREYALKDVDGDGVLQYAEKFRSDPGKKNGLYWETKEGEQPSPLGQLVADARAEGYVLPEGKDSPAPYNGYFFRMLYKQGNHAPGGAYDYIVKGKQIGGFAVVAYPATYGNSGVMTFLVNHEGVVYEKDLGNDTTAIAQAMTAFDPDQGWKKEK